VLIAPISRSVASAGRVTGRRLAAVGGLVVPTQELGTWIRVVWALEGQPHFCGKRGIGQRGWVPRRRLRADPTVSRVFLLAAGCYPAGEVPGNQRN